MLVSSTGLPLHFIKNYLHPCNTVLLWYTRDIKPQNLLVDDHGILKIIDFGSAKNVNDTTFTSYVCTLFYRAPELLFGHTRYSTAVDIWSAGCVFVEMLTRRTLFAGKNDSHVLYKILLICGMPSEKDVLLHMTNAANVQHIVQDYFHRLPGELPPLHRHSSENLIISHLQGIGIEERHAALAAKCLQVIPPKRSSAKQVLKHLREREFQTS